MNKIFSPDFSLLIHLNFVFVFSAIICYCHDGAWIDAVGWTGRWANRRSSIDRMCRIVTCMEYLSTHLFQICKIIITTVIIIIIIIIIMNTIDIILYTLRLRNGKYVSSPPPQQSCCHVHCAPTNQSTNHPLKKLSAHSSVRPSVRLAIQLGYIQSTTQNYWINL